MSLKDARDAWTEHARTIAMLRTFYASRFRVASKEDAVEYSETMKRVDAFINKMNKAVHGEEV